MTSRRSLLLTVLTCAAIIYSAREWLEAADRSAYARIRAEDRAMRQWAGLVAAGRTPDEATEQVAYRLSSLVRGDSVLPAVTPPFVTQANIQHLENSMRLNPLANPMPGALFRTEAEESDALAQERRLRLLLGQLAVKDEHKMQTSRWWHSIGTLLLLAATVASLRYDQRRSRAPRLILRNA